MLRAKSVSCEDTVINYESSCHSIADYESIGSLVDEAITDIQNDKGKIIDVKLTSSIRADKFDNHIYFTALILYEK